MKLLDIEWKDTSSTMSEKGAPISARTFLYDINLHPSPITMSWWTLTATYLKRVGGKKCEKPGNCF